MSNISSDEQLPEVVANMSMSKEYGGPCQVCKNDENNADMFCKECKAAICAECAKKHMQRQIFNDHTIVRKVLTVCDKHNNQFLYFCSDCSSFSCLTCVNDGICEGHNMVSIESIIISKRKGIVKLIESVTADIDYIKTSIIPIEGDTTSKISMAEDIKKQITDNADDMTQKIQVKRNQLVQKVEDWQSQFVDVRKTLDYRHALKVLEELQCSALDAKEQGDEQIILAIPAITSRLVKTPTLPPANIITSSLIYEECDSVKMGLLSIVDSVIKEPPLMKWKITNLQHGHDVLMLPDQSIVLCDKGSRDVQKYDLFGELLTTSKKQNVAFLGTPQSLAFDMANQELLVADRTKRLTLLDIANLQMTGKIDLEDGCEAKDAAFLDNKFLVLHSKGFSQYTRQGKLISKVVRYGSKSFQTISAEFIKPLSNDVIMVSSMFPQDIILFKSNGEYLKTLDVCSYGSPRHPCIYQDTILVPCSSASEAPHLLHISGGKSPQIIRNLPLPLTRDDYTKFGLLLSVDIQGSLLVLLFQKCLRLYQL